MNEYCDGNTQFFDGEVRDDKFYVEKVYLDSPREDCNGYYSDMYEFNTPKEAYKAADRWSRNEEPETAYHTLRSGKPRCYKIFANIKGVRELRYTFSSYRQFLEQVKFYRELKVALLKIGDNKFRYDFEIA